MSWYDDAWKRRLPVSVVPDPGTTDDVTITLQADDSEFWDNVHSTGKDIIVTTSGGLVSIPYVLTGLSYANKTLAIDIDSVTKVANVTNILWLYFANSDAVAPSAGAAVAGAIAGKLDRAVPTRRVHGAPQRYGDTKTRDVQTKSAAEAIYCYVDFTELLTPRRYPHESQPRLEEPSTVTYEVLSNGSAQSAMIDTSLTRWVEYGGRSYAKVLIQAGTSGTTYTASVTVTTSESQTLNVRFLVSVQDTGET